MMTHVRMKSKVFVRAVKVDLIALLSLPPPSLTVPATTLAELWDTLSPLCYSSLMPDQGLCILGNFVPITSLTRASVRPMSSHSIQFSSWSSSPKRLYSSRCFVLGHLQLWHFTVLHCSGVFFPDESHAIAMDMEFSSAIITLRAGSLCGSLLILMLHLYYAHFLNYSSLVRSKSKVTIWVVVVSRCGKLSPWF